MQKNPVQQWIDTIPPVESNPTTGPNSQKKNPQKSLSRDFSFQSDDGSSYCSSVESVLELRKPDPETVLLELGFGPKKSSQVINRIPPRFLQPSKLLPHIDLNKFLEEYGGKMPEPRSFHRSPARTRPRSS
ncbi:ki-ras-induced actin-interacting protein-IP3R-interacting domain olf186-M [Leptinotarsa decemlineata]|uniref:ki-ras-induced actin-interacting protein-IP3R-interacting domain olf186-M n=1 Tax=Leptinotarsa decemlineata TaxID=7539 RepID=UPI000C253038|nr:sperm-specific antigen 2 homolog [Leptinotarsa decemlineata]